MVHTDEWFEVLLPNTNNSFKMQFLAIQFRIGQQGQIVPIITMSH